MTFICPSCKKQIEPEEKYKKGFWFSNCPLCKKKIKRWTTISRRDYYVDKNGSVRRKIEKVKLSKAERKTAIREKHNKE